MKFVMKLIEMADLERRTLEGLPFMERMLAGHGTRDDYQLFLLDLFHVVKHFCPIMAAALSRCSLDQEELRQHLHRSLSEEAEHEKLVEEDLQNLLGRPGNPELHRPSPPVRALFGANYYNADRGHPTAVIGMLYTQEFIASCYAGTLAESLEEAIPGASNCVQFLASHSSLDQEHVQLLHRLLEKIEDETAQEAILASTQLNFYLFRHWIEYLESTRAA